jgi:cephalosporin-C deacetylase-like acetyl esterase
MLAEHIYRLFGEYEAENRARREQVKTAADWERERARLLAAYQQMLGRFPERNDLQPQVTGRIERERYTIEKVIYQTQPGLLVTAVAYVPKSRGERAPGVLVPCGHSENGKAAETYQRVCAGLAGKGYFVLIYDPIGQGERKLYWDAARGESALGGNTTQHSYAGNQYFLAGLNLAQLMVWDSIRGVDYLCSRPEVDPQRIAMAGNSGGGTNTAYTAPLDERIKVAVPCCYITTLRWRRRVWSTGDAEQNLLGQLPAGLDHADLLRLMAPRPVLVGSAALDYFPLEGARESVEAARALYATLGIPERVEHVVAPAPHGYSADLRRATYRWLNRWLDVDAGDDEPETMVEADADLQCTPEGQVALLNSEDAFTLLRRRVFGPRPPRTLSIREAAAQLTGYQRQGSVQEVRREAPSPQPSRSGRGSLTSELAEQVRKAQPPVPADTRLFRYEGLRRIETVTLWPEPDVAVPGTCYSWRAYAGPFRPLLWLDGEGVAAAQQRDVFKGLLADLLPKGWLVLAVDVRGLGETAPRSTGRPNTQIMGAEAFLTYESFVAGRPLFGMRLRDAACALDYLLEAHRATSSGVTVVGWGAGGLLALHLAALDERASAAATVDTLESYRSIVEHERYAHPVSSFVPGAVTGPDSPNGYDLDDLVDAITPRRVLRLRPVDHLNQPLTTETDEQVRATLLSWLRR